MTRIVINPYGNLGNQMFQYMLAFILNKECLNSTISVCNTSSFKLNCFDIPTPPKLAKPKPDLNIKTHSFYLQDLNNTIEKINQSSEDFEIFLSFLCCQIDLYQGHFLDLKNLFSEKCKVNNISDDKILINLRLEDEFINLKPHHGDYIQPPFSWYKKILKEVNLKPVFMGLFPRKGKVFDILRNNFPDAEFLESESIISDFEIIRSAKNKIISVSTFSYLAAYFGEQDSIIHMPVYGFYNPEQRKDINLLPTNDKRFIFYPFPVEKWRYKPEQIEHIIKM